MAVPHRRSDKRVTKEVMVQLARPDDPHRKETAMAQNVSAHGLRVATERAWRPGDHVLISSSESGLRTQARVIYCKRMKNNRFAVGLELLAPVGEWTKPQ
jgi:hypothetical protein